jgi:hypothetical protein
VQQDPGAKSLKYEWREQNGLVFVKEKKKKKKEPYPRHLNSDCFWLLMFCGFSYPFTLQIFLAALQRSENISSRQSENDLVRIHNEGRGDKDARKSCWKGRFSEDDCAP